ncbi:MAG: TIGR04076 family protein [Candidatus Thorarchaeota archaeon]|nr:TIGR04076 family protein [Candidatus Thorarchaeota archaeon]
MISMSNECKCIGKEPRKIIARVISQEGHCAIGHKVGDTIEFDHYGARGDICINALFTMLPVVYAMMHNAFFPWSKDHCKELHACPDPENPVVFELDRSQSMERKATG